MSTPLPEPGTTVQPSGLIDTLQAGFNTVNRNAWLLVLPLGIDLVVWLGPQLTLGTLVDNWLAELAAGSTPSGQADQQSLMELVGQADWLRQYNLLHLLAIPLLGVPSFRAGAPGQGGVMAIESASAATLAVISILGLGLSLAALFYGMLGQAVREGRAAPRAFLSGFGQIVAWFTGLFLLLVAALLGGGIPVGLFLTALAALAPIAAELLGSVFLGVLIWALVYVFFAPDAIFISRVPPVLAIQRSIQVVRTNFWSAVGFIGLLVVISLGLAIIWNNVAKSFQEPGTALAIVGHIYISAGLAAASMTYYKERFERIAT